MTRKNTEEKARIPSKVEVGQLFRVHTAFFSELQHRESGRRKKLEIIPGDILEIRYAFAWHFRIADNNIYAHCTEDTLLSHCDFLGVIDYEVRQSNKSSLAEILENRHYKTVNELLFGHRETYTAALGTTNTEHQPAE